MMMVDMSIKRLKAIAAKASADFSSGEIFLHLMPLPIIIPGKNNK